MPKSLGAKEVSVRGCFPPHAMKLAKAMLEAGLYSEEPITIKGIETNALDLMHDLLLEMFEEVFGKDRKDLEKAWRESMKTLKTDFERIVGTAEEEAK